MMDCYSEHSLSIALPNTLDKVTQGISIASTAESRRKTGPDQSLAGALTPNQQSPISVSAPTQPTDAAPAQPTGAAPFQPTEGHQPCPLRGSSVADLPRLQPSRLTRLQPSRLTRYKPRRQMQHQSCRRRGTSPAGEGGTNPADGCSTSHADERGIGGRYSTSPSDKLGLRGGIGAADFDVDSSGILNDSRRVPAQRIIRSGRVLVAINILFSRRTCYPRHFHWRSCLSRCRRTQLW